MEIVSFVLQLCALLALLGAALGLSLGRLSLGWTGMFLWLLSLMTSGIALHAVR